jgi:hypothetical protein
MKRDRVITSAAIVLVGIVLGLVDAVSAARAAKNPPNPDFTQGGKPDESHDWNLGPTGARGWVYGSNGQTAEARQILVTTVATGSPADGVLKPGDVILGVGDRPFDSDARILFARAIMAAETEKAGGLLRLIRWRDGQSGSAEMKLAVMGTYSDTAPYDCPKSNRIFELGCRAIAKKGLGNISIPNDLNALALLASGKDEHKLMLKEYAHKLAGYSVDGMASWYYGYAELFLAEYAAATGDKAVIEGLRRIATEIAAGQSAVGTWGHKFARANGNCNGYGCMNAPGIVLTLAMETAREAGVKSPGVDRAIAKSANFLRWFVDKGAIPYGDHRPWPGHEDNGKCSAAAVMFDLLGDREATAYFAKMSAAAYSERERGHTGNFFNVLWAMPGVSRCGPLATGAYMKEQAWYYDLARGFDGSFGYQGSPVGEEEFRCYTKWDSTGAYLLAYALPLRSLYLTGKKPSSAPARNRKETDEVIAAGRDYFVARKDQGYVGRSAEQLQAGLSSWSPAVRKRSAQGLARIEGDFVPALLKMLASSGRDGRYGACEALGCLGGRADAAAPQLRALLKDSDPWLQSLACGSIAALGPEARKAAVNDLLAMAASPVPADPRHTAQRFACTALFAPYPGAHGPGSILADSLDGVDRKLLYPVIRSVLENDDSVARNSLRKIYDKLNDRDLAELMPAIIKAIRDLAPSDEMFGDGIRVAGLDLVSRLHIREGMALCVSVIEPDRWGGKNRISQCMDCLGRYGAAAKEVLPQLREVRRGFLQSDAVMKGKKNSDTVNLIDKTIAAIEAATTSPKVVDLKDFVTRGRH